MADPLTQLTHRIRQAGLPRRTYQAALRRLYERRWLCDRFVPGPSLTGRRHVVFLLARASASDPARLLPRIRGVSGLVVCWTLSRSVFAVFFASQPATVASLATQLRGSGIGVDVRTVAADALDAGVPVYFDFEGEWNRYGGVVGTQGYPHAFRDRAPASNADPVPPSDRIRRTTAEMVARPFPHAAPGRSIVVRRERWTMPFSERSMLRNGWLEARSFFNPMAAAHALTDFAGGITFVHGTQRASSVTGSLLTELVERARVHPFLFVSDDQSTFLGFLSAGPHTRLAPAPAASESVRSVIERHLERFDVLRDDLQPGASVVTHRYDFTLSLTPSPAR